MKFVNMTSATPALQSQQATLHSSFGRPLRNLDLAGPPVMRVALRVIMLRGVIIPGGTLTADLKRM